MTGKQILTLLEDNEILTADEFFDGDWSYLRSFEDADDEEEEEILENSLIAFKEILGEINIVDEYTADSLNRVRVWHFPKHNVYIRQEAEFNSYEAIHEAEDFGKEVFPKEITKTVYE